MELKEQIKKIPQKPGVYFFLDKNRRVIYIGKAANLRTRVSSHFKTPVLDARAEQKIKNTARINFVKCESEIEALFLESEFIKRYKPKYNVEWKDEKNFLYVKVKKDEIPELRLKRRPLKEPNAIYYGPYTDSKALRRALKVLSRIFPIKYSEKGALRPGLRLYEEIVKDTLEFGIMKKLKLFFKGRVGKLLGEFEKEMKKASQSLKFEKAVLYRDRLRALSHIKEIAIFRKEERENMMSDSALLELKNRLGLKNFPHLIEAYDISNIFGREAVGSMVVFKDGIPDKDNYRRFKIRTVKGIDDYEMIQEVLKRRFTLLLQKVSYRILKKDKTLRRLFSQKRSHSSNF